MNLIERARLTEEEYLASWHKDGVEGQLDAQLAKALRTVVDWLHANYDWVEIKHIANPGRALEAELEAAGMKRPE